MWLLKNGYCLGSINARGWVTRGLFIAALGFGTALILRWIWVLRNIESLVPRGAAYSHSVHLFMSLDPITGRLFGGALWSAVGFAIASAPLWRNARYRLLGQRLRDEDLGNRSSLLNHLGTRLLWFPPTAVVFLAGIGFSRLSEFDPLLWPFCDLPVIDGIQEWLLGGNGVLRGKQGIARRIAAYYWFHPWGNLEWWCIICFALVILVRSCLTARWERSGQGYLDFSIENGRCPRCEHRFVANRRICFECGLSLES